MIAPTSPDRGSWWLCATDAEFTARARAEQYRMHVGKGRAYANHYEATMPRVRGYHEASPRTARPEDEA